MSVNYYHVTSNEGVCCLPTIQSLCFVLLGWTYRVFHKNPYTNTMGSPMEACPLLGFDDIRCRLFLQKCISLQEIKQSPKFESDPKSLNTRQA